MNLSFAGCGFLGIYHVGVAVCFRKYAPHLLLDKISGASAGAIAACCLLCDLPLGDMTSDVLRVAHEARSRSLGPLSPSFNIQAILLEGLEKFLPDDAHIRVSGRLHISLTRVYDGKNVIVSQFNSREDLLQAILASCFIPVVSGILPPRFHGIRYMDGGFSDNLPTLDENTVTVSPFCGESDICPRDLSSQLFHVNVANTSIELSKQNISRFARILFPPKLEVLSNMCKQGFDDALRFLHRNNLINCTRCLAVQSTFVVSDTLDESMEYDPQCMECIHHRQEALVANLPDTVMTVFQNAIDSANKGLINWVFRHKGMKLLSVLSLPYTLPADIVYATFTKLLLTTNNFVSLVGDIVETRMLQYKVLGNTIIQHEVAKRYAHHFSCRRRLLLSAPLMGNQLWLLSKFFLDHLNQIMHKLNHKTLQLSTNLSCQLSIADYGSISPHYANPYDIEACDDIPVPDRNQLINVAFYPNEGTTPSDLNYGSSRIPHTRQSLDDDTFEHILQVTAHHEAVMAYYYMDENNKVKVTEIFDVTESDSTALLSPAEREINTNLQFDDDWTESSWLSQERESSLQGLEIENELLDISDIYVDDFDDHAIFSDPESEWTSPVTDYPEGTNDTCDLRPESDQPTIVLGDVTRRALDRKYNYNILEI